MEALDATERRAWRLKASLLATGMLLCGTLNTILLKRQEGGGASARGRAQSRQAFVCGSDVDNGNGTVFVPSYECEPCQFFNDSSSTWQPEPFCTRFEQPVYQTYLMFAGEFLCILVYMITVYISNRRGTMEKADQSGLTGFKKFLFILPTLCDLVATTLMNLGLFYIAASVYQMLRGAVVVFTGVLSVLFLKRRQYPFHWVSMALIVLGVMAVGLTSVFNGSGAGDDPALGITLVLCAQVFSATQFVVEEKFLGKYNVPPLEAVGMEGVFGLSILAVLMPILYVSTMSLRYDDDGNLVAVGDLWDAKYAYTLFANDTVILVTSLGSICSVAIFNFCGVSVTKLISATSRTTIDACRTLLVWIVSVALGWELFDPYQIIGFTALVFGTFMYNEVFHLSFIPFLRPPTDEYEPLLTKDEPEPLWNPAAGPTNVQTGSLAA